MTTDQPLRRLVLVGPMSGLPDFNYPAFDQAEAALDRAGFRVWSPTTVGRKIGFDQPAKAYLRLSIQQVMKAQGLAFLPESTSPGASAELAVGRAIGIPCQPVWTWLQWAREADPRAVVEA